MILDPLALILPIAATSSAGCADHWIVGVSKGSFEYNGAGVSYTLAELDAFEARVVTALKRAINRGCVEGKVAPEKAAAVNEVLVMSASGASEPHFYRAYDDVIAFEWVFAEEALKLPADEDIIAGVSCWTDPDGNACTAMEIGD
jgi:hypothetical protein